MQQLHGFRRTALRQWIQQPYHFIFPYHSTASQNNRANGKWQKSCFWSFWCSWCTIIIRPFHS
jgi:hypothetical protein